MATLLRAPVLEYSKDPTAVILRDEHQPTLSFYILEQLRRRNQFCDVELHLKSDIHLQAHRVILASSSPYFMKLLSKHTSRKEILLQDVGVDVTSLEMLIDFMYTSVLRITEGNVQALCIGAKVLQLDRIKKTCCKFMIQNLKKQNCVQCLNFAKKNQLTSLLNQCKVFMAKNIIEVAEDPSFAELLTIDDISSILAIESLALTSEKELIDVLLTWMKHEPLTRQNDLYSLLLSTDLPQLNLNGVQYQLLQALHPPSDSSYTLFSKLQQCFDSKTESGIHTYENAMNTLFAVGGISATSTLNSVEKYDHCNTQWIPSTALPKKKSHSALVAVGGMLYSLGGLDGNNKQLHSVDVFETQNETWSSGSPMPSAKSDFGVVFDGDRNIYCIGGYAGSKDISTVDVLDLKSNTWEEGPTLQQSRSYVQAAVVDNTIYAIGGTVGSKRLASVEKLDLNSAERSWKYAASLNIARSRPGVAAMDGRIYAVGGYSGTEHLSSVECYYPTIDKWVFIEAMSVPRNSPAVASIDNQLIVAGGHDGKKLLDSVESYNPETKSWISMPSMSIAKCDFAMCSLVVTDLNCVGTWM